MTKVAIYARYASNQQSECSLTDEVALFRAPAGVQFVREQAWEGLAAPRLPCQPFPRPSLAKTTK